MNRLCSFGSFRKGVWLVGWLLLAGYGHARPLDSDQQIAHLRNINFIHMNVMATSLSDEDIIIRQDVSDLVELELRREGIPLRPYVANEPDRNYPLLEIVVDIKRQAGRNAFTLQLALRDYVIIQRNEVVTTATTYGLSQSGSTSTELALLTEIKNEARSLMADFLNDYRSANGGKR